MLERVAPEAVERVRIDHDIDHRGLAACHCRAHRFLDLSDVLGIDFLGAAGHLFFVSLALSLLRRRWR